LCFPVFPKFNQLLTIIPKIGVGTSYRGRYLNVARYLFAVKAPLS
jgi:hypothetical protein